MYIAKKLKDSAIFQGKNRSKNYFEGWYFKCIDKESKNIYAIIPGISFGSCLAESHTFIQVINANTKVTHYFRYGISEFKYSKDCFEIELGKSKFSRYGIELNCHDAEQSISDIDAEQSISDIDAKQSICDIDAEQSICGRLTFSDIVPYPVSLFSPGIMGPFSYIPFMECNHGIVNVHSIITGSLKVSGSLAPNEDGMKIVKAATIDFNGGYGYVEKDWGSSFPKSWIWLQCNHFHNSDISIMFSVATIPWLGRGFHGYICFIRIGDQIITFATYTGAKILSLSLGDYSETNHAKQNKVVKVTLADHKHSLQLSAESGAGGLLKAPKKGLMDSEITESITSSVYVSLKDSKGNVIFEGNGKNAGMELAGEYMQFLR